MGVKSSVQESNRGLSKITNPNCRSGVAMFPTNVNCFDIFSLLSRRFVFDPTQVGKEGSCIRYNKTIVKMQTNCLSSDLQM